MKENLMTSVIGFDFDVVIKDKNDLPLKTGIRSTVNVNPGIPQFQNRIIDRKWFTHFDDDLYNKILDCRKYH